MKKLQLIYSPYAGTRDFSQLLDFTIAVFQTKGYEVHIFRTTCPDDFHLFINRKDCQDFGGVIIAGGDGSVNLAINALMNSHRDIPLGIIPAGTSNDFARHLGMPMDLSEAIMSISEMDIIRVDVGVVNRLFFINVCSGGLLTNIAHDVDLKLKNTFGRMAYYVKGVQELPRFRSIQLKITTTEVSIEDDFFLFLVLNGSGAGGFTKVGGPASIIDGKLDFVGIKPMHLNHLLLVFSKILLGEHINDKRVIYFQTNTMTIERLDDNKNISDTDVDGEKGPDYPLNISIIPQGLQVLVPHKIRK